HPPQHRVRRFSARVHAAVQHSTLRRHDIQCLLALAAPPGKLLPLAVSGRIPRPQGHQRKPRRQARCSLRRNAMCLAIYKPAGKVVPEEHLEEGFTSNPDGAGYAYIADDGKVHYAKGFFKYEDFIKHYNTYVKPEHE